MFGHALARGDTLGWRLGRRLAPESMLMWTRWRIYAGKACRLNAKKKGRDGAGREVGERNILRFWYADEDDKESAVAAKVVAATFYHEQCAGWSLF